MPAAASVLLAMSQEEVNVVLPTGSNCSEHSEAAATTATGARDEACASAGLTASVSILKPGMKASAASARPNSITGLRPMRSERRAKKMCSTALPTSAAMISMLTSRASTLTTRSRKNWA